jgi:oligosaccharide repeat unit polymerase
MNLDLAITAFALMTIGNYWVGRSVLYPPFIFCTMFLLDFSIYRAQFIVIDPLHTNTLLFIGGGAFLFSAGGLLSRGIPEKLIAMRLKVINLPRRSKAPKYALLVLLALSFPLIVHERISKAAQGTGDSFLERARNATVEQAEAGRRNADYVVNSIPGIAIGVALLFMLEEHDWTFWCASAFALLAGISGGGRTDVLTLVTALTGIHLIRARRESFVAALGFAKWSILLFLIFFMAFIYASKDISAYNSFADIISFFLVGYLISPTAALDRVVQRPGDFLVSNHTFQFLLKPAAVLHLTSYTPPPVLDQFIFVPLPTNVYTVYRFYLTDFGFIGALICLGVIGMLHSMLHRRARQEGSRLSLVLFGFSLFSVVMVIFDDHYFEVGAYIRAILFCLIYWGLSSFKWKWLPARRATLPSLVD